MSGSRHRSLALDVTGKHVEVTLGGVGPNTVTVGIGRFSAQLNRMTGVKVGPGPWRRITAVDLERIARSFDAAGAPRART